jgi:hypothetical protein
MSTTTSAVKPTAAVAVANSDWCGGPPTADQGLSEREFTNRNLRLRNFCSVAISATGVGANGWPNHVNSCVRSSCNCGPGPRYRLGCRANFRFLGRCRCLLSGAVFIAQYSCSLAFRDGRIRHRPVTAGFMKSSTTGSASWPGATGTASDYSPATAMILRRAIRRSWRQSRASRSKIA